MSVSLPFGRAPLPPPAPGPGASNAVPPDPALDRRLQGAGTYNAVFDVVRAAVRRTLGVERPGLGLALSNLPPQLGAYWQVAGNLIVVNESLVEAMKGGTGSPLEANGFVFVVLAHEYLHALGYLDEASVRRVTAHVARATFGPRHLVTRMAEGDLWQMYPFLASVPPGDGRHFKVVRGFDLASSQTYIR
jgi:hypothetical protein